MIQIQSIISLMELFVLLAFILLTFIDLKKKEFPSVLTSGLLFIVANVQFQNIQFGLLAFILAFFLLEAEFFEGMADIKIITIMGFFINSLGLFLVFTSMIVIFGVVYKILMVKVMKQKKETAFVPVLLAVFIALLIIKFILK